MVSGLMESTSGVWSGDVDLGDGSVKSQYAAYCERLNLIDGICCQMNDNKSRRDAWHDLLKLKPGIVDDRRFVDEGIQIHVHGRSLYTVILSKCISVQV